MLMVVDIGNTNSVIGVFRDQELLGHWKITTRIHRTSDEYAILFKELLKMKNLEPATIQSAIIASVVPPILPFILAMFNSLFHIQPLVVGPGIKTGISVLIENPKEVGADRVVNAVAAYKKYRAQCIIIDFGTATTFDIVSKKGEYLGGLIFPGITISTEALFLQTAKLPRIEIAKPPSVIGRNTVHSIQSGIFFGYCELVDGLIRRIKASVQGPTMVIATGGYAELLGAEIEGIDEVIPMLTLDGLRIIFEKN